MYYLLDTNIFLHAINNNVVDVAQFCKKNNNDITITETIITELKPGYYLELTDEATKEIYSAVRAMTDGTINPKLIRVINVEDVPGAKEELKKIRERFYGWINDPIYLRSLIEDGQLQEDEIRKRNFRNKDLGECELIAIAKTSDEDYTIVTDDKGKVFLHPESNIFNEYALPEGIRVLSSSEWLVYVGYK